MITLSRAIKVHDLALNEWRWDVGVVGVSAEVGVPLVVALSCSVHLGGRPGPAHLEPYQ